MTYSTISLSSFRWKFRVTSNPKLRQWFHFEGLIISAQSKQEAIYIWYEEGNIWAWDCTQYVPTRPLNNTFPLAWRKSRKKSFSSFVFQQAAHDMNWFEYWQEGKHIIAASLWVWKTSMLCELQSLFQHYFDYNQSRSLFQDWNLESGLFEVLYSRGLILVCTP